MEKHSAGRGMIKLIISAFALFLLVTCGMLLGACGEEISLHKCSYEKSSGENQAATCGATGYDIYVCSCGEKYALPTKATGNHNFVGGYCSVCGLPDTYDDAELLDILNKINSKVTDEHQNVDTIHKHNYSGEKITVGATCFASGYIVSKCECGSTAITGSVDKLAHKWASEKIIEEATCTSVGSIYQRCEVCGTVVLVGTQPQKGHQYSKEMVEVVPATCTEDGYKAITCEVCGDVAHTETIPATGHHMVWETAATHDDYKADCTHGEKAWYHCDNANCTESWGTAQEITKPGDHVFDKVLFEFEATCTTYAYKIYGCSVCDTDETITVLEDKDGEFFGEPLGHEWEREDATTHLTPDLDKIDSTHEHISNYHAPTCVRMGEYTWTCECGRTLRYKLQVVPDAHTPVTEGDNPVEYKTVTEIYTNVESESENAWDTATYKHYICENCGEWIVKTSEVLSDDADPGDEEYPEYTVIKAEIFGAEDGATGTDEEPSISEDYPEFDLSKFVTFELKNWKTFTPEEEGNYSDLTLIEAESGADVSAEGSVTVGDVTISIGSPTCMTDGLSWYECGEDGSKSYAFLILPALGHNYEIPTDFNGWDALVEALQQDRDASSSDGIMSFNRRSNTYVQATCDDYGVLFLTCTNCFKKTEDGKIEFAEGQYESQKENLHDWNEQVSEDEETPQEGEIYYGCDGIQCDGETKHTVSRIAVTVIDGELYVVEITEDMVKNEDGSQFLSDRHLAEKICDLDLDDDSVVKMPLREAALNAKGEEEPEMESAENIELLLKAFEGTLEGNPTVEEYEEPKYNGKNVFDPLGHDWSYINNSWEAEGDESWIVLRDPVVDPDADEDDYVPTSDCTVPGYTGRYCTKETGFGGMEENQIPHKADHFQKFQLIKVGKNETLESVAGDLADCTYDLKWIDSNESAYYLIAVEYDSLGWGESEETREFWKVELEDDEVLELFGLLLDHEHELVKTPLDPYATCGRKVEYSVHCANCDVKFEDEKDVYNEHLGNFGHFYTIGACGTAFGSDHSIVEYDYCLDCGRRVGLKWEEQVQADKTKKWVETTTVLWTEGYKDGFTGEMVKVQPCQRSAINDANKSNYRHFPFDRERIEGLIHSDAVGFVPDYKLYSAIWKEIDKWYEGKLETPLLSSPLAAFLCAEHNHNGLTAHCFDCYNEFSSISCQHVVPEINFEPDQNDIHVFIVEDGEIKEYELIGSGYEEWGNELNAYAEAHKETAIYVCAFKTCDECGAYVNWVPTDEDDQGHFFMRYDPSENAQP